MEEGVRGCEGCAAACWEVGGGLASCAPAASILPQKIVAAIHLQSTNYASCPTSAHQACRTAPLALLLLRRHVPHRAAAAVVCSGLRKHRGVGPFTQAMVWALARMHDAQHVRSVRRCGGAR